jgi:GNAT superfamily N-acetyltransferase
VPVIRRAEETDLAALCELRRAWTEENHGEQRDDEYEERFAGWLAREESRRAAWLAEADGDAVGMVNLAVFERMPQPGSVPRYWGYLSNMYVLPGYRNRGIGGLLVAALLAYADAAGFVRVVLSPSERSVPFYQRAGFGGADMLMVRVAQSQVPSSNQGNVHGGAQDSDSGG